MSEFNPKLLNDPLAAADELLEGLVEAYNGKCYKVGRRSIVKNNIPDGKVSLLVGGGAGHEPIYHALVGKNMADGAACGDIFAAPAPNVVQEATTAIDRGNGVLYLYGNYAGDVMNFDVGCEMSEEEGVSVRTVLIADDVASAPPERKSDRRGIAGLVPVVKMVGAASQRTETLDELADVAEKICLQTRSIGAAMAPGSIPATGKPTFELERGMIGLGMGIHGEAGVADIPMTTADDLSVQMLDLLLEDYQKDKDVENLKEGDEIVFFINSLGATTMMECLVCMRKAAEYFEEKGIEIFDVIIGPYVTCQEMAGISFSITRVDEEMKELWSAPCESFCYSKMAGPLNVEVEEFQGRAINKSEVVRKQASKVVEAAMNLPKSTNGLTKEQTQEMIEVISDKIIISEPLLSQADRDLGDGDHGLGMARGFTAVQKELKEWTLTNLRDLYQVTGNALLTSMGGASGVVFGSLFLAGGKVLHGADFLGTHEIAHILEQSLKDVMSRGGAKPGDKTMIDALHPASEMAKSSVNLSLNEFIQRITDAAEDGKNNSCNMIATMGRAKTLGEKTLGLPDAGAISVTIILQTMQKYIEQNFN